MERAPLTRRRAFNTSVLTAAAALLLLAAGTSTHLASAEDLDKDSMQALQTL